MVEARDVPCISAMGSIVIEPSEVEVVSPALCSRWEAEVLISVFSSADMMMVVSRWGVPVVSCKRNERSFLRCKIFSNLRRQPRLNQIIERDVIQLKRVIEASKEG